MTALWQYIQQFFSNFFNLMGTFRVRDFLDILLVAVIIYHAIKLIRETRAIQLMKGIFLLSVGYFFVTIFDMQAVSYILQAVFRYGVVILVVLFQPEIRQALESLGQSNLSSLPFFGGRTVVQSESRKVIIRTINHVASAASDMSFKRIGALIVFEKDVLLGEVIKTGTLVEADSSVQLMKNIFFPNTPLHDGAMIIREGKIHAAGCILPLSENTELDANLGTRHRAAIGVSEVSDAIVVIVSEETGTISIAKKGEIQAGLSDGELREKLNTYLFDEVEDDDPTLFERIKIRLKGDKIDE